MNFRKFKGTEEYLSQMVFGCLQLGEFGWGKLDRNDLFESLYSALDCGINFFDTADVYGLGLSESNLKEMLGSKRKSVFISTKFGVKWNGSNSTYDNTPRYAKQALEASLKRLGTDYIDLYQVHWWDGVTPFDEIFNYLELFVKEGKIKYYGVSNIEHKYLSRFKGLQNFKSFSMQFSLAHRDNEEEIRATLAEGINFLSWGTLAQGLLSGKYDQNSTFGQDDRRSSKAFVNFQGDKLHNNLRIVETLKEISASGKYRDASVSQLAIAWSASLFEEEFLIIGSKSKEQLVQNCASFDIELFEEDFNLLNQISLSNGL